MTSDPEVWTHTFGERAPDFVLAIRGEMIGRVYHCEVRHGGPRWVWTILCSIRWVSAHKPTIMPGGEADTKAEAIKGLRAAWKVEREWRREMREVTATTHGCWSPFMLAVVWRGYELESTTH
ncbi:hypothetical protein [Methylorubrum sp. POS3]|uniref:hypothetical protein n=1 Tax=Methylorubrum sp. POS3 TaxID=2998492 RepID=UPI0037285A48